MPTSRRAICWSLAVLGAIIGPAGCNSPARRTLTGASTSSNVEPIVTGEVPRGESAALAPAKPTSGTSFVDRHPLLRKPRQYYDSTDSNKAVKTAAAAFVGVPAGIVGELKQIVVGVPKSPGS